MTSSHAIKNTDIITTKLKLESDEKEKNLEKVSGTWRFIKLLTAIGLEWWRSQGQTD